MGVVYLARDEHLHCDVALKVLRPGFLSSETARKRFRSEALTLAKKRHPNLVTIHDFDTQDGLDFIVMEYVEGSTLSDLLERGSLPESEVTGLGLQLARGMIAIHGAHVIHRDVKPGNLKVTPDGVLKILDFGLAKLLQEPSGPEADSSATATGHAVGTVAYMAPELLLGKPADERSDLYAVGVVLYQMATGRLPHTGNSKTTLVEAILTEIPQRPRTWNAKIGTALESVIVKAMNKDSSRRHQSSSELLDDLQRATTGLPPARPVRPISWRRGAVVLASLVLATAAAWMAGLVPWPPHPRPRVVSLAVLPLRNLSNEKDQEFFAEGMTDELTSDLANISGLRVISRGSAMQFAGKKRPPTPEIAKKLDVDAVVEGSVHRSGDKVRINAQLIDARSDRHLWSKSFERNSRDVLALQDELASAIAQEIHVRLTPEEQSRLTRAASVNPEAYDAYLKGRYFFNRPNDENLSKAIEKFEEAIRLDPKFAPAHSGLSDVYLWAGYNEGVLTNAEAGPKAKAAAQEAIRLDDASAEAHASLATYQGWYAHDWPGSEAEYRRSFALNPNYSFAHDQFGILLALEGRLDESVAEGRRAAELDPLSPQIPIDALMAYTWQGRYPEARELARKAANLDPTYFFPPFMEGWMEIQAGRVKEAIPLLEKARALGAPPFLAAWLGYAHGVTGDRARAMAAIDELKALSLKGYVPPFNLALVYLGLGDRARALDYLEQAYDVNSQWMPYLRGDRTFDSLRSEPRFQALMKKLNFPA